MGVQIIGTGSYVPDKLLTNEDLERMLETSDEWIYQRTGIRERRISGEGTGTVDMAVLASKNAIHSAGIKENDIQLIIIGTVSSDYPMPSGACVLQGRLKAKNAVAFDVSAACSGFIYGLAIADGLIASGHFNNALVVGADSLTKFTDYQDRSSCILFGDGAGAVVVKKGTDGTGILGWKLYSDGAHWDKLYIPGGGSANPASLNTVRKRMHYIRMEGRDIFKLSVTAIESAVKEVIEFAKLKVNDVDLFIPHQANRRIIETVSQRIGIPDKKVFINIERYGNTSAASIPLALDEAVRDGRIKKGDNVLFASFGAGLTWGAMLLRW